MTRSLVIGSRDNRDLSRVRYVDKLVAMAGVDRNKLPDLRPTGAVLGTILPEVARELGLREDVRVVMGTPDTESAAIGSGAVRDFEAHLSATSVCALVAAEPAWSFIARTDQTMSSKPMLPPTRYMRAPCSGAVASPSVPAVLVKTRLTRPRGDGDDEHNDRGHNRCGDNLDGILSTFLGSFQLDCQAWTLDCDWKKA